MHYQEIYTLFSSHGMLAMKSSADRDHAIVTIGPKSFSIKIDPIAGMGLESKKLWKFLQEKLPTNRVQFIFSGPGDVKLKLLSD